MQRRPWPREMNSISGKLKYVPGTQLFRSARDIDIEVFEGRSGIRLPNDHLEALGDSNGATVYGGYARMFGINVPDFIDAERWNRFEYWKFAWEYRCQDYFCFAETVWGDQYAYHTERLQQGDARVYLLDRLSMTPEIVASSFSDFLESELIRIARVPYDVMMVQVRQEIGDIEPDIHLTYSPSLLIGGSEDISNIIALPSRISMIFNGDIASQIDAAPESSVIKAVVPYDDDAQRPRLRLVLS